jgi:hypothetical protein
MVTVQYQYPAIVWHTWHGLLYGMAGTKPFGLVNPANPVIIDHSPDFLSTTSINDMNNPGRQLLGCSQNVLQHWSTAHSLHYLGQLRLHAGSFSRSQYYDVQSRTHKVRP